VKLSCISISIGLAVLALTLSVAPASAHEFHSEAVFVFKVLSTREQTFTFGSSGHITCTKLELEPTTTATKATKLTLAIDKYEKCTYSHGTEAAEEVGSGCSYVLKSALLNESQPHDFIEGTLALECSKELSFKTPNCTIGIPGGQSPLSAYTWVDEDTEVGHYESEVTFNLNSITYTIAGTGCGSSGANGTYKGSVELTKFIVE
jgi:hypothetical protein